MPASELSQQIGSTPPEPPLDWAEISEHLDTEFRAASTSEERGAILGARADAIERIEQQLQLHGEQLEKFIDVCDLEYKRLIVHEASIDSHLSFETMLSVTDREIAAGRMSEDFALREIAKEETRKSEGAQEPQAAAASGPSAFDRLKHWLHLG